MGRRVKKTVYDYNAGSWQLNEEKLFVYDGWNLVEEITVVGATETSRYFVWGLDLSQSLQGAGGIGGLIASVDGADTYYFAYDGNGNVGQVIDASSGNIEASYQYDPFGNLIKTDGAYADDNPFRFSSKYHDDETDLIYYGLRYYEPELGRWINRDPIEEDGGLNLYGFVKNNPLNKVDKLGLDAIPIVFPDYKISAYGRQLSGLGHAGVLIIDPKTGLTKYYEYGRYDKENRGEVKNRKIPDVEIDPCTCLPTPESLKKVLAAISRIAGKSGKIAGAYIVNDNFEKMKNYAQDREKMNNDPKRKPYSIRSNNCGHFMKETIEAGGVKTPWMIDPRPNSYAEELRGKFENLIDYPSGEFEFLKTSVCAKRSSNEKKK